MESNNEVNEVNEVTEVNGVNGVNEEVPEFIRDILEISQEVEKSFDKLDEQGHVSEEQLMLIDYQTFSVKNKILELGNELETLLLFLDTIENVTDVENKEKRMKAIKDYDEFLKFAVVLYSHVSYLRSI